MKSSACLIMIMVFLLVGMLGFVMRVKEVTADGTITIRSDGLVYPSTAPIDRYGDIYIFAANIINYSIVVLRDNIVLDGAGIYRIEGQRVYPSKGIDLTGRNNVTVRNMQIRSFYFGIFLNVTTNIQIHGIIVNDTLIHGENSSNIVIHRNNFVLGGIDLSFHCSNILVSENVMSNWGIIGIGSNSTVHNNVLTEYSYIQVNSNNNMVYENNITNSDTYGIAIWGSYNKIFRNNIVNGEDYGIHVGWGGKNNIIYNNNIVNTRWVGIYLDRADENVIFHNNFINNGKNAQADPESDLNLFDAGYPAGGNYWSDYAGVDEKSGRRQDQSGSDGIGDSSYVIQEWGIGQPEHSDNYPLMGPINIFEAGTWNEKEYFVDVVSNSIVSGFQFDVNQKSVSFTVNGDYGTTGFCRVAIPKELLWVEDDRQWSIFVDNEPTSYTMSEDGDFTYLYFTYNHSTKIVSIQGTHAIPEFSTITLPLAFLMLTMIPLILAKKKRIRG